MGCLTSKAKWCGSLHNPQIAHKGIRLCEMVYNTYISNCLKSIKWVNLWITLLWIMSSSSTAELHYVAKHPYESLVKHSTVERKGWWIDGHLLLFQTVDSWQSLSILLLLKSCWENDGDPHNFQWNFGKSFSVLSLSRAISVPNVTDLELSQRIIWERLSTSH